MTSPNRYTWPLRFLRAAAVACILGTWYRYTLYLHTTLRPDWVGAFLFGGIFTIFTAILIFFCGLLLLWVWFGSNWNGSND
jgi:hypothetical protein